MKWLIRLVLTLVGIVAVGWLVLVVGSRNVPAPSGAAFTAVTITNVNVVDIDAGVVRARQNVIIRDGVITAMADADHVAPPADIDVIDATGRFLMPGLWDMHVHLGNRFSHYHDAAAFVANGVFYVRDLSSDCIDCVLLRSIDEMRDMNARFQADEWLGPDIVELSSNVVHGPRGYGTPPEPAFLAPATREDGIQAARFHVERGADFIKTYNSVPPPAYQGLVEEAERLGIYVGGHIPWALTIDQAVAAGHRTVEHARYPLIDCAEDNGGWHETYRRFLGGADERPNLGETYIAVLDTADEQRCDDLFEQWAAADSYYVPTHLTRLAEAVAHERSYDTDARALYTMAPLIDNGWSRQSTGYAGLFEQRPDIGEAYYEFFERGVEMTARAHAAGVKVMAGTDTSDLLIYAGFSLHDELALYAGAGLSMAETLRTATVVPAEFVGQRATHGGIRVGQVGNVVLLNDDPLADIENTTTIDAIFYRGRYYDREELDEILDGIAWRASGLGLYLTIGWPLLKAIVPAYIETGEIPL